MGDTDFEPGDPVWNPEQKRYGIIARSVITNTLYVACAVNDSTGRADLIGWERVDVCSDKDRDILRDYQMAVEGTFVSREDVVLMPSDDFNTMEIIQPGHVQVRVDDLDTNQLSDLMSWHNVLHPAGLFETLSVRVANAIAAQRGESAPIPDGQGAPSVSEPLTMTVKTGDEAPASIEVSLPCPDCGEDITNRVVVRFDPDALSGGYYLGFDGEHPVTNHKCPLKHVAEPTEAGVRLGIRNLRYASLIAESGRMMYVGIDHGGLFEWSYLVNVAEAKNTPIRLGWDL